MKIKTLFCLTAAAALLMAQGVVAQHRPGMTPANTPPTADNMRAAAAQIDCNKLVSVPNPPMTMDACLAMQASATNLGSALAKPGGERPGDDAMTCDQIAAELHTMQVAGVSAEHAAESLAAGEQLQQSQRQAQAAAAAMGARQTAETAAVAGAPNLVGGAVALRQAAEQQALAGRASAQIKGAQSRTTLAIAAATEDLAASMAANPRWGRLISMASARCAGHPILSGHQTP